VHTDTRDFYRGNEKLGLGSSAAVTVAVYAAFAELLKQPLDYRTALHIHHNLQGRLGSGIDVAAAFFGGLLKFRRDDAPSAADPHHWNLPENLRMAFIWTGHGSATPGHVRRFEDWLRTGSNTGPIDALIRASESLFETPDPMAALATYAEQSKALDVAAGIGIYDSSHQTLDRLAIDCGVVYKPCGAGGGDMGAAFSDDDEALVAFAEQAAEKGFTPLALETASNGIEITR